MRTLSIKLTVVFFFIALSLNAQNDDSKDPFGGDPFGGLSVDSLTPPPLTEEPKPETSDYTSDLNNTQNGDYTSSKNRENQSPVERVPFQSDRKQTTNIFNEIESSDLDSPVQNAVIEGIQITADKGGSPDEKIVSGYFIFRDKPSSYFYEIKLREKKLIFEFNDTKTGGSPVPSVTEAPIKGFTIFSDKVDINKDVKGLKPEYHNLIRVIFDLDGVPDVRVNDEYSIITFSFKWSNNPQMLSQYTLKDKTPKIILWSTVGVGGVGLGTLAYFLLKPTHTTPIEGPIPFDDLPKHE